MAARKTAIMHALRTETGCMQKLDELRKILTASGIETTGLFAKPIGALHGNQRELAPSYPIFCIPTPHENALALWKELSDLTEKTGYLPVIGEGYEYILEPDSWDEDFEVPVFPDWEKILTRNEEILRAANETDADQWFAKRLVEEREAEARHKPITADLLRQTYDSPLFQQMFKMQMPKVQAELEAKFNIPANEATERECPSFETLMDCFNQIMAKEGDRWDLKVDPWPDDVEPSDRIFSVQKNQYSAYSLKELYIDLFPVQSSWALPMFDNFPPANNYWGGAQSIHMAVLKKWHTEYGAELVAMSGATYELMVSRPPTTKEAAINLAVEHYLYCQDCVTQTGLPATIKHRAASILNAKCWYFWWD